LLDVKIHTDGGCSGNPGPGGWAFVITEAGTGSIIVEKWGGEKATTNNRMELMAAISALEYVRASVTHGVAYGKIAVYTDSQYVQKGMTSWIHGWKQKNWKNSAEEEVKNKDLWLRLDSLASGFSVSWTWVQAHAGNELNERADRMTQVAIRNLDRRG